MASYIYDFGSYANQLIHSIFPFSKPDLIFDIDRWNQVFQLPFSFESELEKPDASCEGKRIIDTHMLVYLPATIEGKSTSIETIQEFFVSCQGGGGKLESAWFEDFDETINSPYCFLIPLQPIPNAKNFIENHPEYSLPRPIEIVAAIAHSKANGIEDFYQETLIGYSPVEATHWLFSGSYRPKIGLKADHYGYLFELDRLNPIGCDTAIKRLNTEAFNSH